MPPKNPAVSAMMVAKKQHSAADASAISSELRPP